MIGEVLGRGDGQGDKENPFYKAFEQRILYNVVGALQIAGEPVTAERILRFMMTAATSADDQKSDSWKQQYHNRVMERAAAARKTTRQQADFGLIAEF